MAVALRIGQSSASGGTPHNVSQITSDAQDYEFNAQVPLKYWLRTASALIKQAEVYMREGDDEMTYFLLFRHAHLVLTNLETHPESKRHTAELTTLQQQVNRNLKTLDVLKPRINKKYDEYVRILKEREARRQTARKLSQQQDARELSPYQNQARTQPLHGRENRDYAARLAHQEFSRRAPANQRASKSYRGDNEDLSQRLQAIRARVEPSRDGLVQDSLPVKAQRQHDASFNYPSVPLVHTKNEPSQPTLEPASRSTPSLPASPPILPPKPPRPGQADAPPRPEKVTETPVPATKAKQEPAYSFAPGGHLENGDPLRTIFLPPTVRTTFLRIAHQNSQKNLETCGFLAGTLRANALFVSALIIPSQTATSDTCEMTNESELFDYVDSHELMILGWIHTHPTQTCFMSSRDLHTHAGYQMMLAESVAVVCAPSKGDTTHGGDWGVYRLTDPPGKMAILQCEKPGIFHPHEVDNVYTDAMRPGHVMEIEDMKFEVVDLRK